MNHKVVIDGLTYAPILEANAANPTADDLTDVLCRDYMGHAWQAMFPTSPHDLYVHLSEDNPDGDALTVAEFVNQVMSRRGESSRG